MLGRGKSTAYIPEIRSTFQFRFSAEFFFQCFAPKNLMISSINLMIFHDTNYHNGTSVSKDAIWRGKNEFYLEAVQWLTYQEGDPLFLLPFLCIRIGTLFFGGGGQISKNLGMSNQSFLFLNEQSSFSWPKFSFQTSPLPIFFLGGGGVPILIHKNGKLKNWWDLNRRNNIPVFLTVF